METRQAYPTDLTDAEWRILGLLVPAPNGAWPLNGFTGNVRLSLSRKDSRAAEARGGDAMKRHVEGLSHSKHFTFNELAEGVYAAIALPNGSAVGNAGIIDLGDQTLVAHEGNSVKLSGPDPD